jgi:hypothetical protein
MIFKKHTLNHKCLPKTANKHKKNNTQPNKLVKIKTDSKFRVYALLCADWIIGQFSIEVGVPLFILFSRETNKI